MNEQICDDCGKNSICINYGACTDYHLYGSKCCSKNVCADGCDRKCEKCGLINNIHIESSFSGYYKGFECNKCNEINYVDCYFYGDLKKMCERYCGVDCYVNCNFIIKSTSRR